MKKLSEWKEVRLGDLCEIKYGKDHKKLKDGSIPVYGSGGIIRYVDSHIYNKQSVLIPRKGTLNNLFFVNIFFWTVDTIFWTRIFEEKVFPKFLYYSLLNKDLARLNVGTAVPSLTTLVLNEVKLPLPPITEQKAIAAILSSLDDKIELNNRINKNLEETAQAIFKRWFVDFEFPNKDGLPYKSNGGEMVDSEMGAIPKGWRVGKLGDVSLVKGGKRLPKGRLLGKDKTEHPYIRVRDLNNENYICLNDNYEYVDNETFKSIARYIVQTNDIIISIVGTIGLIARIHESLDGANLTENCAKLVLKNDMCSEYLYYFLKSEHGFNEISKKTVGAVQAKLPLYNIQSFQIIIPTKAATNNFSQLVSNNSHISQNLVYQKKQLVEIRNILLPKLMSGEISANTSK